MLQMSTIPQGTIDDILARVDIVELIRSRVPLKRAGREWQACCPFHNEKTPSFSVSPRKQFYYCFGCHASGNALRFLMEYERMEFRPAIEMLAAQAGVHLDEPGQQDEARSSERKEDLACLLTAQKVFARQLKGSPAASYLEQRGVSAEMVQQFGLGFAADRWEALANEVDATVGERTGLLIRRDDGGHHDRFRNRLMFPIRDTRGQIIGFGGRTLGDDKAKYLNSPETRLFHKGQLLYGLYEARQARRDPPAYLVVEGYMDVISLAQFGIDYAVATLGTAATAAHMEQLLRLHPRLCFCFDGDKAGRRAASHALDTVLPLLRDGHQIHFLFLPEGHDPDTLVREIGAEAFEKQVQDAMPLSQYLPQSLATDLDLEQLEGRATLSQRASDALQQVKAPAFRAGLKQRLQELTKLPSQVLDDMIPAAAAAQQRPRHREPEEMQRPVKPLGRGPVRRAIVLLLAYPELAEAADDIEALAASTQPGAELLSRMIDALHDEPKLHCGALLERFKNDPLGATLGALAGEETEIDAEQARVEFSAWLESLCRRDPRQRLRELSAQAARAPLSSEEKLELNQVLQQIQQAKGST